MCLYPDVLVEEREAFINTLQEEDPGSKTKQSLRQATLLQRNEEKAKQLFDDLIAKKTGHSVREALYVFLGFNSRYNEFNRKLVFDEYFNVVEKVYEHGQFYFKYFNWYMTPIAVTLEECLELEKGFKALLERVDPLKTQLHNAA